MRPDAVPSGTNDPVYEPLYKWLDGTKSTHGGSGGWRKGRWRSVRGELIPCAHGLHLCREQDLLRWIAPTEWEAVAFWTYTDLCEIEAIARALLADTAEEVVPSALRKALGALDGEA